MKKKWTVLIFVWFVLLFSSVQVWSLPYVKFTVTTDIFELIDKDYQFEFMLLTSRKSAFSIRLGHYRTIEDPPDEEGREKYAGDDRHYELGGRWRLFLLGRAPNLLFLGAGFDNRPWDNTITPLGEVGFNVILRPLVLSVVGFGGYEVHFYGSGENRYVKGVELRAGIGF